MKELIIEFCTENNSPEFINRWKPKYQSYLTKLLNEYRMVYSCQHIFMTPERIVFKIQIENPIQKGGSYEIKGPERGICFDEEGNPTYIYKKFMKQKSKPDSKVLTNKIRGKEYIFIQCNLPQEPIETVLEEFINDLYNSLNIKRKTKNILAVTQDNVLNIRHKNLVTSTYTIICGEKLEINNTQSYLDILKKHSIYLDEDQRKELINSQLQTIAQKGEKTTFSKELDVLANLSERPKIFLDKIDKGLLDLPEDIFRFFLQENPRLVLFKNNNKITQEIALILQEEVSEKSAQNYTKALEENLSHIYQLYKQSTEEDFTKRTDLLKNIVFLEDLGTMYDKVQRVKHISIKISDLLSIGEPITTYTSRAAELAKTDLTSSLVIVHPKLHGTLGKNYALKWGEKQEVAHAIYEYLLPLKRLDNLPQTMAGSILSIADKIDTIVGLFSVGLIKNNSDDPYKIKSKADGIIRIIERSQMDISLKRITNLSINLYESFHILKQQDKQQILKDVLSFFNKRFYKYLESLQLDPKIIQALLGNQSTNITLIKGKGEFLQRVLDTRDLQRVRTAYIRLKNMVGDHKDDEIQLEFLTEDQEKKFYENFLYYKKNYHDKIDRGDFESAFQELLSLSYEVEKLFNLIYIHTPDEALKNNRLNMLLNAYDLYYDFCDFDKFKD